MPYTGRVEPWLALAQTLGFPIAAALLIAWAFVNNKVVSGTTHAAQAEQFNKRLAAQDEQYTARIVDLTTQRDTLMQATLKNGNVAEALLHNLNSRGSPV